MNPILPPQYCIPDVEARPGPDNRLYLYGSRDISGGTRYCSYVYHGFSSADLHDWTDHGVSFRSLGNPEMSGRKPSPLFAPDCIEKEGTYYLYYCLADGSEWVAESPSPMGPFKRPREIDCGKYRGIDPAVLLDDDGTAYYFWGQFNLRGARLKPSMDAIDTNTLQPSLLEEKSDGFHEGASIRKRGDWYYLVYADISRGKPTCLGYAMSRSPLGPYEKKGIIIDNMGSDPETWNNHGSITCFNDNWYVFYHRSSEKSRYSRRVCVEPIRFNSDGTINEVEMTTQGIFGPIPCTEWLDAYRACFLEGDVFISHHQQGPADQPVHEVVLSHITNGDYVLYKYIDLDSNPNRFEVVASCATFESTITIRVDGPDGKIIGQCPIIPTGGWHLFETFTCEITPVSGPVSLCLQFTGPNNRLAALKKFRFQ